MSNPKPPLYPLRVAAVAVLLLAVLAGLGWLWWYWIQWPWGDWCWQVPVAFTVSCVACWLFDQVRLALGVRYEAEEEAERKKGRR
jgi:hypothetical protein